MTDLANACVETVRNAGGRLEYKKLYEGVDFEQRRSLPSALKEARAAGVLGQSVAVKDGKVLHEYFLVGSS